LACSPVPCSSTPQFYRVRAPFIPEHYIGVIPSSLQLRSSAERND
jgi:hypothetical protein